MVPGDKKTLDKRHGLNKPGKYFIVSAEAASSSVNI